MLNKLKEFFILLFKLIIVAGALYFIYLKVAENGKISFEELNLQFNNAFSENLLAVLALLTLSVLNWIFEIKKWQTLAGVVKKLSFRNATEQCLASHTAANITPNKLGEFAVKAAYFGRKNFEKIILLNGVNHLLQLGVTVVFGFFGMIYMIRNFDIKFPEPPLFETVLAVLLIILLLIVISTFQWANTKAKLKEYKNIILSIPKPAVSKTFFYAVLRYLLFSHQFYFLMYMFEIDIDYFIAIQLIFAIYFIASVLPSINLFDWAVKGSVAVWVFSFVGINELSIVAITTIMWILNFAVPSLVGSIFVLKFKV